MRSIAPLAVIILIALASLEAVSVPQPEGLTLIYEVSNAPGSGERCLTARLHSPTAVKLLKSLGVQPANLFYVEFRRAGAETVKAGCYVGFDKGLITIKVLKVESGSYIVNYTLVLENLTLICYSWSIKHAEELFGISNWSELTPSEYSASAGEVKLTRTLRISKEGAVIDSRGRDLGDWVFWLNEVSGLMTVLLYPVKFVAHGMALAGMATVVRYSPELRASHDYTVGGVVIPHWRIVRTAVVPECRLRTVISCGGDDDFRRVVEFSKRLESRWEAAGLKLRVVPSNRTLIWENVHLLEGAARSYRRLRGPLLLRIPSRKVNCTSVTYWYYVACGGLGWALSPVNEVELVYDSKTGVLLEVKQLGTEGWKPGVLPAPLSNYFMLEDGTYPIWYSLTCNYTIRLVSSSLYEEGQAASAVPDAPSLTAAVTAGLMMLTGAVLALHRIRRVTRFSERGSS